MCRFDPCWCFPPSLFLMNIVYIVGLKWPSKTKSINHINQCLAILLTIDYYKLLLLPIIDSFKIQCWNCRREGQQTNKLPFQIIWSELCLEIQKANFMLLARNFSKLTCQLVGSSSMRCQNIVRWIIIIITIFKDLSK